MMNTQDTTDPAQQYRETLRELQAALEAEESIDEIDYQIDQTAKEFDRVSEAYETRLDDLHDQKASIIREADRLRREHDAAKHRLPLDDDDQKRVAELREQLQQIKAEIHPAHEDLQRKQRAFQLIEKELTASNRRPRPTDGDTLAAAQTEARQAKANYDGLSAKLRLIEWQIQNTFDLNAMRYQ